MENETLVEISPSEIRTQLKLLTKTYLEERKKLEAKLNEDAILYFHSKPNQDPLRKGKRMSVCAIVAEGKIRIGVAKLNNKDIFDRAKGREEALEKAKESPTLELEMISGKSRLQFKKAIKGLLLTLRSEKEMELFSKKKVSVTIKT